MPRRACAVDPLRLDAAALQTRGGMTSPQAHGARVPASAAGAPATGPSGAVAPQFLIPGISQAFPFPLPADSAPPATSGVAAAAALYGFSLFPAAGSAGNGAGAPAQGNRGLLAGFPVDPALLQRGQPGAALDVPPGLGALGGFPVPSDPPSSSLIAAGQGPSSLMQLHSMSSNAGRSAGGGMRSSTGRADLSLWPGAQPEADAPKQSISSTTVQAGGPASAHASVLSLVPVPLLLAGGSTGPNPAALLISSGSSIGSNESSTTAHASLTGQLALHQQNPQQQSLQVGLAGFPGAFQTLAPNVSAQLQGSWIPGLAQLDQRPASAPEKAEEARDGTETKEHGHPELPERQGKRSRLLDPADEVHLDMRLGLQGGTAPGTGASRPRDSRNRRDPSSLEGPSLGPNDRFLEGGAALHSQRSGPKQETSTPEPLTVTRHEEGADGHSEKHQKSQSLAPDAAVDVDGVMCKLRAKRGCATHPRSIAERVRRLKISENMRKLADLVPGIDKQANTADMLEEAIDYMKHLQEQLQVVQEKWPHVEVEPYVPRLDRHQTRLLQPVPGEGSPFQGQAKGVERYSGTEEPYVDSDEQHSADEGRVRSAPVTSATGLVAFLPTPGIDGHREMFARGGGNSSDNLNEPQLTERTFL